jgi:hypothetical protein
VKVEFVTPGGVDEQVWVEVTGVENGADPE